MSPLSLDTVPSTRVSTLDRPPWRQLFLRYWGTCVWVFESPLLLDRPLSRHVLSHSNPIGAGVCVAKDFQFPIEWSIGDEEERESRERGGPLILQVCQVKLLELRDKMTSAGLFIHVQTRIYDCFSSVLLRWHCLHWSVSTDPHLCPSVEGRWWTTKSKWDPWKFGHLDPSSKRRSYRVEKQIGMLQWGRTSWKSLF